MMMGPAGRRLIFNAAKARGATFFTAADVAVLDRAIDDAVATLSILETVEGKEPGERTIGSRGIKLMHSFEGCRLKAYPDPGSKDGHPWTIGWGSTGPGIVPSTVWTQAQADERFMRDVNDKYGAAVDRLLGDSPTTQSQFDAMVSLTYNIGIGSTNRSKPGGFTRSTVLRKHKAGDFKGAAEAFLMWNKNDGKVMRGLTRRRMAEADLYDDDGEPA
jgi:lysozyme